MELHPKYTAAYPGLARYIRSVLPRQASTKLIVEAAGRYGQFSPDAFRKTVARGSLPWVMVVDIPGGLAGAFAPKLPDWVVLDKDVADEYESGTIRRFTCKDGSVLDAPGAVLLHELMHWGDYYADKKMLNGRGPYIQREAGEDFELFILGGRAAIPSGPHF